VLVAPSKPEAPAKDHRQSAASGPSLALQASIKNGRCASDIQISANSFARTFGSSGLTQVTVKARFLGARSIFFLAQTGYGHHEYILAPRLFANATARVVAVQRPRKTCQ
jgi:hypothetical protein